MFRADHLKVLPPQQREDLMPWFAEILVMGSIEKNSTLSIESVSLKRRGQPKASGLVLVRSP